MVKNPFNNILQKDRAKKESNALFWLNTLETLDGPSQLRLCIQQLTKVLNNKESTLVEKINTVFSIDEHTFPQIKRQSESFARSENLKKTIAAGIISNHYAYARILFLAYSKLIEKGFSHQNTDALDSETKKLLLIRAIQTATSMLKWRYFDHNSAPTQLWLHAHHLYRLADYHGALNETVIAYEGMQETTFKRQYLILQMLGSMNHNCLIKSQIDCIEKLLKTLVLSIRPMREQEHYHSFYVDLAKDKPATRIRPRSPKGNCLFWDIDEAEHMIDTSIDALNNQQSVPLLAGHGIRATAIHLDTLQFLKKEWSKDHYVRQRRKMVRETKAKTVSATLTFPHIIQLIDQHEHINKTAKGFLDGTLSDRRLSTSVVMRGNINTMVIGDEKWVIQDESSIGLGSIIKSNIDVKPNKLIAIHNENNDTKIAIGAIRNIKQLSGGKLKTGIEILSDKVMMTQMKKLDTKKTKYEPQDIEEKEKFENHPFEVIHLAENMLTDAPASLIIAKADFIPNSFYELVYKDQHEIIMLQNIMESGDDWVRVPFPEDIS